MPTGKSRWLFIFFAAVISIGIYLGILLIQWYSLEKVTIDVPRDLDAAGFFVAKEKGYFKKQGIRPEFRNIRRPNGPILRPFQPEDVDVGGGMLHAWFYKKIIQQGGLKLVADKGHNILKIAVSKKLYRGELNKEDIGGQTFSVIRSGNPAEILTEKFLKWHNLTFDNVQLIFKPFPEAVSALADGSIFGAALTEPYFTAAIRDGAAIEAADSVTLYPGQQNRAVYYSENFMVNREETAVKFMAAYIKGLRYINDYAQGKGDAKEFFKIMKKYTDINDFELFKEIKMPPFNPDGYLNMDSIMQDLKWYSQNGYIDKVPDLSEIVDNEFVKKALSIIP